ncbi:MAG: ATP-dependent DNA helicase UvrD2, partial [Acidimicrobiales bacterium]
EKLRRGLVDFDDLLARCADALERDPSFAAAQRWRWRHVFVDEFQDVNPLQHRLLLAWLGDRLDLCVVGDPHQAIYGWNGADPHLLDQVTERWPSTQVVRLDANHRCSPQIVAAAAAVLGGEGARLRSAREEGAAVAVREYGSGDGEAFGVASEVAAAHAEGFRWSSMAVLTRTNAQAVLIAEACRGAGVPVRVPGREGLLELPAARWALARLQERSGAPLAVAVADLAEWAGAGGWAGAGARGWAGAGARGWAGAGAAGGGDLEAAGALQALAELARQAQHLDPTATVGGWVATLPALLGRDRDAGSGDAVTVCSFHRAKGLEWPAVWACGLEDGLVPIGHATTPAALAEERRLLYVALTRAGARLACSWARERRFGERAVPRAPSPWLHAVAAAGGAGCSTGIDGAGGGDGGGAGPAVGPTPEEWQERIQAQRDRLRGGGGTRRRSRLPAGWPPPDGRVLEALRGWRAATARASAVPAHVVLHDTILEALASARPADEAGLLAIPGLGPVKASRYGPKLLGLVASVGGSPAPEASADSA